MTDEIIEIKPAAHQRLLECPNCGTNNTWSVIRWDRVPLLMLQCQYCAHKIWVNRERLQDYWLVR